MNFRNSGDFEIIELSKRELSLYDKLNHLARISAHLEQDINKQKKNDEIDEADQNDMHHEDNYNPTFSHQSNQHKFCINTDFNKMHLNGREIFRLRKCEHVKKIIHNNNFKTRQKSYFSNSIIIDETTKLDNNSDEFHFNIPPHFESRREKIISDEIRARKVLSK